MYKSITEVEAEAKTLIDEFKTAFNKLTGIVPLVICSVKEPFIGSLSLEEMENIANTVANREEGEDFYNKFFPEGIRTKKRKKELVIYRQIFFYICRLMGYGTKQLEHYLKFDHSTVIHSTYEIEKFLDTRDEIVTRIYTSINDECKKRIEHKRNVQSVIGKQSESKSVLSPMLYVGLDRTLTDKPKPGTSRTKGKRYMG